MNAQTTTAAFDSERLKQAIKACTPDELLAKGLLPDPRNPIQTDWVVLTGGPSCGKTTLLEALHAHAFRSMPPGETSSIYRSMSSLTHEVAREVIAEARRAGFETGDCFKNCFDVMQDTIAAQQLLRDTALAGSESRTLPLFIDRGCCDAAAHYLAAGMGYPHLEKFCQMFRYKAVLLLENLPFVSDGIRFQDEEGQKRTQQACREVYERFGHRVITVPVLPPAERLAWVLNAIGQ